MKRGKKYKKNKKRLSKEEKNCFWDNELLSQMNRWFGHEKNSEVKFTDESVKVDN
jgi:hypothetical protein